MRLFKERNYKTKLVFTLMTFTLIPVLIIMLVFGYNMFQARQDKILSSYLSKYETGFEKIYSYNQSIQQKIRFISSYMYLINVLKSESKNDVLMSLENQIVMNDTFSALFADGIADSITIYTTNANVFNSKYLKNMEYLKEKPYGDRMLQETNDVVWEYYNDASMNKQYLCACKRMNLFDNNVHIIEIMVDLNHLTIALDRELSGNCYVSLDDLLISENEDDAEFYKIYSQFSQNKKVSGYYVREEQISGMKKSCIMFVNSSVFSKDFVWLTLIVLICMVLTVFVILCIIKIVAGFLTKRLEHIYNNIKTEGDVDYNQDEFDIIIDKFNELAREMQKNTERELSYKKEKLNLELKLLQERISPHFLYNTLGAAKWRCNDDKLEKVIDSLVRYYRIVLNEGSDYIEVAKEVECIQEYFKIVQFSYGKEFAYKICVPENCKNLKILKHIVQPIAENAFMHGINSYEGINGEIFITFNVIENNLFIVVENTGNIITDDEICRIKEGKRGKSLKKGGGYALYNIINRIKLCYGENYGVEFYNNDNKTRVVMKIKAIPS